MAAYVNGANGSSASAAGTFTVSYAPAAGNQVVVGVAFPSTPGGTLVVKDNLGNTLVAGASQGTAPFIYTFGYATSVPSGVSSFVATWSGSIAVAMAVAEYSGAAGIDLSTDATRHNNNNNNTATLSVVTGSNAGDFIVMATATTTPALTVTVGTLRQQNNTQSGIKITLQDNSGAANTSVTNTGTQTAGTFWCAAAVLIGGPSLARVSQDIVLTATRPSTQKARVSQDIVLTVTTLATAKARVSQDVVLLIRTTGGSVIAVGPKPQTSTIS